MDTELDEAQALFAEDCAAQLNTLECELLALETDASAEVSIDAAFRAVHTIKGNAAMLRHGEIEWFAHVLESVLHRLREGLIRVETDLVSLLLACCDHLRFLLSMPALETEQSRDLAETDRTRLIGLLVPYLDSDDAEAELKPPTAAPPVGEQSCWHLRLRFPQGVLRQGMDPFYFLRHLETLGQIQRLICHADALPALGAYDPELCYLHFEVRLASAANKQAIEDVFSFVRDGASIQISLPEAQVQNYADRIDALPDDELHTGEMLTRIGALTPAELADGLRTQRRETRSHKPLGSILIEEGKVASPLVEAVLERQGKIRQERSLESLQLRVSAGRLEALDRQLGMLHAGLATLLRQAGPLNTLDLAPLQQEIAQAQALVEEMRSTRFSEHFHRLRRVLRDAAQALGKNAELRLGGGEITLDRWITEPLLDALMHLTRNAVDHGIETSAQRLQAGKPAHGTLNIVASTDEDGLLISVSDDGAGVDFERVRTIAIERGLIAANTEMTQAALAELLFAPGFSTANVVSHYSGRGVGLDAVREAIRTLAGSISVHSRTGIGCCFEIHLPTCHRHQIDSAQRDFS